MTNERDKELTDELVSETYRKLESPQAPDHLNRAVLSMAADKRPGRTGFVLSAWMKPVTFAATIALSLAIVLELSEMPTASVPVDVTPASEPED